MSDHYGKPSAGDENESQFASYKGSKVKKQSVAKKMESKSYTNVRCGQCGKFGHSHEIHKVGRVSPQEEALLRDENTHLTSPDAFHKLVKARGDMIKRNDFGELLAYAQMRRQQKGGQ